MAAPIPQPVARVRWGFGDAVWAVAASLIVSAVVSAAVFVARHGVVSSADDLDAIDAAVASVAQFAVMFGLVALTVGRRGRGLGHEIGLRFRASDWYWPLCGVGAAISFSLVSAPISLLWSRGDHQSQAIGDQVARSAGWAQAVLVVVVVVVAPFVEEIVFRGVVLRAALRRMPATAAVLVSGGSFAALHLLDPATFVGLPTLFGLGCFSAILALRSGELGRSIYLHAGFNAVGAIALVTGVLQ